MLMIYANYILLSLDKKDKKQGKNVSHKISKSNWDFSAFAIDFVW